MSKYTRRTPVEVKRKKKKRKKEGAEYVQNTKNAVKRGNALWHYIF